jgi:soluble cytochrome b562
MREYTDELAEEAQRNPQGMPQGGEGQEITGDMLQEMLDEIERLMNEGKTAEAMALMEQLRQLMENMQVTQGQGGEGQGNGPMRDLGETLRDQQDLSDDAYRDMQEGRNGQGQPQEGEADEGELSDRQRELRQRLGDLQDQRLPGDGTETGEAGRDALDRAEEAMRQAERALEEGDLDGALDHQADAMEAMREGMEEFGEALAEENREGQENGGTQEAGRADPNGRDPLGREPGDAARIGSDRNMVQNDPDQRAQELLDEIRRRSGEAQRPTEELDYLKRLLELF